VVLATLPLGNVFAIRHLVRTTTAGTAKTKTAFQRARMVEPVRTMGYVSALAALRAPHASERAVRVAAMKALVRTIDAITLLVSASARVVLGPLSTLDLAVPSLSASIATA